MNSSQVRLSVLMAVHNGAAFLPEALDSLRRQTRPADEIVAVDDASTDATSEILFDYRACLPLRILRNEERRGLTLSLLRGWAETRGAFVARMDADDISMPRRFERQMERMERSHSLGLCGTWGRAFGDVEQTVRMPTRPQDLRAWVFWGNPFIHSSVVLRRSVFEAAGLTYDPSFAVAQDYDLWARALNVGISGANLPEVLVACRLHGNSTTVSRRSEQNQAVRRILRRMLECLTLQPTSDEIELHRCITHCQIEDAPDRVVAALAWLKRLACAKPAGSDGRRFMAGLRYVWFAVCYRNMVAHDSKCPKLYWKGTDFDPLGWRRWLLRGALLKKRMW